MPLHSDDGGRQNSQEGDFIRYVGMMRSESSSSGRREILKKIVPFGIEEFLFDSDLSDADNLFSIGAEVWERDELLALQIFREASEAGSAEATTALGDALNWLGADEDAIPALENAITRGTGKFRWLEGLLGESLLRSGDTDYARIVRLLESGMEESLHFGISLAKLLEERGDYMRARELLSSLVERDQYGAALLLGNLLTDRFGEPSQAEAAYLAGIESGDANSAHNLAVMLLQQGESMRAREFHELAQLMGDHSALE